MSKQHTVRSHKKREHIYNNVENISQFCQSLESWGDKTIYVWKEKGETKSLTFTEFTAMVYRFADGLLRIYGRKDPALGVCLNENIRIGILGETSPYWVASTPDELDRLIENTTAENARENCEAILDFYGTNETGESAKLVAEYIVSKLDPVRK